MTAKESSLPNLTADTLPTILQGLLNHAHMTYGTGSIGMDRVNIYQHYTQKGRRISPGTRPDEITTKGADETGESAVQSYPAKNRSACLGACVSGSLTGFPPAVKGFHFVNKSSTSRLQHESR